MKYLIMHGHFYQPPRENPFLGVITKEASASPAHDWNERITNECYSPNAYSRVLDNCGRIVKMVNNYEYLSFNFGPTLLDYIAQKREDILEHILEADKKSIERLGYGNAIAQVYNHVILPLSKKDDMKVQIKWGLFNFEKYFKRQSKGIWLSETAINLDVVDALYDCGVKFTILSPFQAHIVKNGNIIDVSNAKIDISKPYWLYGNNGKRIAVFFYDAQISQAIAFEHLLTSSDKLSERIRNSYNEREMINIATDGETYGHHEPFADMCIARYFTENIKYDDITITNYEHYLNICPPTEEVILHEGTGSRGTSWSCIHGVERWRSDCGCGGHDGWSLSWREPLREAFDILRNMQDKLFSEFLDFKSESRQSLREEYVRAMYNDEAAYDLFEICQKHLNYQEFRFLMESYKYSLFAYTSCGWFFDDVSRIEPRENMQYAERSFYYARALVKNKEVYFVEDAYNNFLNMLSKSISNIEPHYSARYYYEKEAKIDAFSELYIANHFIFSFIASDMKTTDMTIYDYKVKAEKVENNEIEGKLINKFNVATFFKAVSFEEEFELKNNIKLAKSYKDFNDAEMFTLTLKEVMVDVRDELSNFLFKNEISNFEYSCKSILPSFEEIFMHYKTNNITPNYDYRRIMGAIYSPILRSKIEEEGRSAYDSVSESLKNIRNANIFISTSGISSLIGENIKKSLIEIETTNNPKIFINVLEDIKFLSTNDMPIDRHTFENKFYRIINKHKSNLLSMTEQEKKDFLELGRWLNFNMEVI